MLASAYRCPPTAILVGLLYFEGTDGGKAMETARLYIEIIAENIGLAIANLQLRDRLTHLAVRDPLTGLLNRRSLDDEMNRLRRDTVDRPTACLMVDIDHFKRFNDEFGHDAGDHVMRQVATLHGRHGRQVGFGLPLRRRGIHDHSARSERGVCHRCCREAS